MTDPLLILLAPSVVALPALFWLILKARRVYRIKDHSQQRPAE